jgi:sugar O-acyltransferase (sialic acid O-acetyltransferase NeuD family)
MKARLLIWGAGGHGKVAADTAMAMGSYSELAFIDDDPARHGMRVLGLPVLGASEKLAGLLSDRDELFIAIGDNSVRTDAWRRVQPLDPRLATLLHPLATVSRFAHVGKGTLVMPRVVINAGARIGTHCIVNTGAIVEHDCVVEDYVHLSPAVTIGGEARIEEAAHLGIGAIVLPGVRIARCAVVGAGSVVLHDLPAGIVAVGVPARNIRYETYADPSVKSRHNGTGETRGTRGALDAASVSGPQASRI